MANLKPSALILGVILMALVVDHVAMADCSTTPWPTGVQLNKSCTDYYQVTATSVAASLTLTNKSKAVMIKNMGVSDVVVNVQGGTVTASSGGMPVTSGGGSLSDDITTIKISYISMTATSTKLWLQVDY